MALKALMIRKKLTDANKSLEALRQKDAELEKREAELTQSIEEAQTDEERSAVEEAVNAFDADKTAHEEAKGNLERQILKMSGWVILYGIVSFFFVSRIYAIELIGVLMVYPVLKLYNGERGKAKWMKWFFYVYYPLHLIIIGMIRLIVYGNVNICL
jgi:hypothetical protein